jgi:hypothetical protein
LDELEKTPWWSLAKTTAWLVLIGVVGVAAWIFTAAYTTPVVASPLLAVTAVVVFGGLYAVGQWTMRIYVNDEVVPLFDSEIRRLAAAWTLLSFLFIVGAAFFLVPGFYVLGRLAPYIPRVTRGDDVFAGVTATWEGNEPYVKPVMGQSLLFLGAALFAVAFIVGAPLLLVVGVPGVTGTLLTAGVAFVFGSAAYVVWSVAVNAYMVGVAREIGSLDAPRAL